MEESIKKLLKQLRLNESLVSTLLGGLVVLVVGVLLYNYFSTKPSQTTPNLDLSGDQISSEPSVMPEVQEGETPKGLPTNHRVVKGETLWSISEKYYGSGYNWVDISGENKLNNPNVIETDQELVIPNVAAKKQTVSAVASPNGIAGDSYTTVAGDSLWTVAVRAYGDGYQWPKLYQENREKVGINPNVLEKGVALSIPR